MADQGADQARSCARCGRANPLAARFCASCGDTLTSEARRRQYAAHPNESVASVSIVSTVMPYASARAPQTYRIALLVGLAVPVIAALLGALPFALLTAVFVVPVVFVVYLYDVNLWEDAPVPVVLATFLLGGALGLAFTWAWNGWVQAQGGVLLTRRAGVFDITQWLVPSVLVPVVAVLLMLVGPLVLASRPRFDDLMDGLTFGIVSGVAYAAFETLVLAWPVVRGGAEGGHDVALWLSLVVNAALLKPLVYGCAVGVAAAEFSGLGEGYDGLSGRFLLRTLEAMVVIALFQSGLYVTSLVAGTTGVLLGMLWGVLVAAFMLVRVRTVLQRALIEGAVEAAARAESSKWASGPDDFCAECEMPLLGDALFCVVCGASVRARTKSSRGAS